MKKIVIFGIILIVCALANKQLEEKVVRGELHPTEDISFEIYKLYHSKADREDEMFTNFHRNLQTISEINSQNLTWKAGINKFSFSDEQTFYKQNLGASGQDCEVQASLTLQSDRPQKLYDVSNLPPALDWRDQGVVSQVKDQQQCASCWSFAASGALESHWSLKTNVSPPILSEQQLIDCSQAFNNKGCEGGLPSQAFEYIKYMGGLNFENVYSYFDDQLSNCMQSDLNNAAFAPLGSYNITAYDEDQLLYILATEGPVTVAFQASESLKSYQGGVWDDPNCTTLPQDVNHAALAVGYGFQGTQKYWILKNSWGQQWGENGYFRMIRGKNACGIADCASYPQISEPTK